MKDATDGGGHQHYYRVKVTNSLPTLSSVNAISSWWSGEEMAFC